MDVKVNKDFDFNVVFLNSRFIDVSVREKNDNKKKQFHFIKAKLKKRFLMPKVYLQK